jgi:2-iminobutanoate/2-iminopropanoate deaminase
VGSEYSFSPAVITESGKTVWLAGQLGFTNDTGASLAGNFDAQVRQAFKNLEKTLQRGRQVEGVVWMTVAVSDGRYSQRFTDIGKEIYGSEFPASTLLTAASFAIQENHGGDHTSSCRRCLGTEQEPIVASGAWVFATSDFNSICRPNLTRILRHDSHNSKRRPTTCSVEELSTPIWCSRPCMCLRRGEQALRPCGLKIKWRSVPAAGMPKAG